MSSTSTRFGPLGARQTTQATQKTGEIHDEIEVFDSMDVDSDRRLAFPEFRQGLSLLGMTSVGETQSSKVKNKK